MNTNDFLYSVHAKKYNVVESMLKQGMDPNTISPINGLTVLQIACKHGDIKMVKLLLKYGANPNLNKVLLNVIRIKSKYTIKNKILELLLDYGADPNVQTFSGIGSLGLAFILAENNDMETILILLNHPNINLGHDYDIIIDLLLSDVYDEYEPYDKLIYQLYSIYSLRLYEYVFNDPEEFKDFIFNSDPIWDCIILSMLYNTLRDNNVDIPKHDKKFLNDLFEEKILSILDDLVGKLNVYPQIAIQIFEHTCGIEVPKNIIKNIKY